jgi:hypothetical protein
MERPAEVVELSNNLLNNIRKNYGVKFLHIDEIEQTLNYMDKDELLETQNMLKDVSKYSSKLKMLGIILTEKPVVVRDRVTNRDKIIPRISKLDSLGDSTVTVDLSCINNGVVMMPVYSSGRMLKIPKVFTDIRGLDMTVQKISYIKRVASALRHNYSYDLHTREFSTADVVPYIIYDSDTLLRMAQELSLSASQYINMGIMVDPGNLDMLIRVLISMILVRIGYNAKPQNDLDEDLCSSIYNLNTLIGSSNNIVLLVDEPDWNDIINILRSIMTEKLEEPDHGKIILSNSYKEKFRSLDNKVKPLIEQYVNR